MKFTPTWRNYDVADIPTFTELQDITGMAYTEDGTYVGPTEKPDMQLVINPRTNRQYWAPKEYDEDSIKYGMAKLEQDFNSKEWWGMVHDPGLTMGQKLSTAYIEGWKQLGKTVANAPTKVAAAVAGLTDAVGLDAGAMVMAGIKTNPIFLASSVARKGLKATAEDYVQLFKDIKTPKGKMGTTASFYRVKAQNWQATINKYLPDVDDNVKAHSTLVAIGGLAGQVGGSLLVAAATNGVGGLPAVAAVFGGQQFYDIREEYLNKGYSLDQANIFAGFAALSEGGLEAVGFGHLLKYATLSRSFRNVAISGLIESFQEMSQTGAEELITNLSGVREETITEILAQIAISGIAGFVPGAGFSAVSGGANISREKAQYELDRAVEQTQQKKEKQRQEGIALPGTTPKQELELAKANKGSNPIYEIVKNLANSRGITNEKAIDGFYYFARNKSAQGMAGEVLLDGLGKQMVAYKDQLKKMDKVADSENRKAAEDIKHALSAESAKEYHDNNVKALKGIGATDEQVEVAAAQADRLMANLSDGLGLDLQQFKPVQVTAIPQRQQEKKEETFSYDGEVPFQDKNDGEIKAIQQQINELDKLSRSKPRTNLLSTLRKTGVDYANTRLDPQKLKDLRIKNVPVSKGGLGGEAVDYLVKHGFMQDFGQLEQTTYADEMERADMADEMLERAVGGEEIYRLDDMEKINRAQEAEAYKAKLQEELDGKLSEKGKRGYIAIGDTLNKIVLGDNADITTLHHELMHHFKNLIETLAAQGNKKAQALKAQMDKIIEAHKDEVKQEINKEEEVLSEAYEAWLYSGVIVEDPQEQSLYEAIKKFFEEVYDSVKAITGIRIDPEIDMFFRQLTGQMPIQMNEFAEGKESGADMAYQNGAQQLTTRPGGPKIAAPDTVIIPVNVDKNVPRFDKVAKVREYIFNVLHACGEVKIKATGTSIYFGKQQIRRGLKKGRSYTQNQFFADVKSAVENAQYAGFMKKDDRHNLVAGQDVYYTAIRIGEDVYAMQFKADVPLKDTRKAFDYAGHSVRKIEAGKRPGSSPALQPAYTISVADFKEIFKAQNWNRTFYQIAGRNAKTADPLKLNEAERLSSEGMSAEEVRKKTGWFKGPDGKWRFEIEDGEINEEAPLKREEIAETDDHGFIYYYTTKLGDLYDSPELYAAYPDLRDISVSFISLPEGKGGSYHPGNSFTDETISLSSEYLVKDNPEFVKKIEELKSTEEYKKYNAAYKEEVKDKQQFAEKLRKLEEADEEFYKTEVGKKYAELQWGKNPPVARTIEGLSKTVKKSLIHEIQHAIQERESFARGASVKEFMAPKLRKEITDKLIDTRKKMARRDFAAELEKKAGNKKIVKELFAEEEKVRGIFQKYLENKLTVTEAQEGEKKFKELLSKVGITAPEYYQLLDSIEKRHKAYRSPLDGPFDPLDIYRAVYGEVEARNTEKRADLTAEERANISPESTQDIASEDSLIITEDGTELPYKHSAEKILYQGDKDLIATHATKSSHVNEILESGQVVAPSLAITKKGQNELNKGHFGDIVLVMNPDRLSFGRDNIYNRDIYSPRLPSPVYLTEEFGYISQSEWETYKRRWEENPEEFKKKYGGTFDEVIGNDKYIFEGFNPRTEKRIYKKYTPANLLAYIRKESLLGGESWNYGLSSFLAKMSKQMNSREELRKESWNLANREEAEDKYEELQTAYSDLLYGDIQKYSKFSELSEEDFADFLKYNYEGHPEKAAEFLKVEEIPESLKIMLNNFVDEALSLPRSYFEAKPMRNVPLSSFVYAITKKGTLTPEQVKKFESYGVEVKEVDSIKDFDFSSLDVGGANDTNAIPVYFQRDRQQAYRDARAQQTGSKAADEKPSKERIASDIEVIRRNGVEKYEPKSRVGRSFGDWGKHILITVRQRAGAIDPKLKAFFDKLDYFQPNLEKKFASKANGYIKKFQNLTEADKNELDYYINNQCIEELHTFLKEKRMEKEYEEVRQLLNFIYAISNKAGIDMGFVSEYFPTSMIDYGGFLDYMKGTDKWSYIQKALREADPEGVWSDKEKAEAINKLLRGYRLDPVSKPKNAKERKILYKSPDLMRFYEHSDVALIKYLQGMSQAIAINKAFGKGGGFNTDETIGAIVLDLIDSGAITNKEEAEVKRLLKSRLSYGATPEFIAMVKNVGYLQTMNNITSAITQLGDLYAPFYKYSFGTALKSIFGKAEITKTDLGLDKIWEEFSDSSKTGIAVDKLFKVIGLEKMDSFGKNVAINASLINLREQAASGDIALLDRLAYTFGKDAQKVLADIKAGKVTDDVKILIWADLADTQPIGRSGVPSGYLDNPHGRLFYQLKTFSLNQISLFYADSLVNIQKGIKYKNKAQLLKGVGNGFKLLLLLTAGNAGADVLKNLIMGRDIDISDTVISNLLWNVGVSKYTFYKGKRDGYARAILSSYLQPPQLSIGDDLFIDARKIYKGDRALKDTIAVTYFPFGRAYYWWFGGGRTSEIQKAEKEKKANRNKAQKERQRIKRERAKKRKRKK